MLKTLRTKICVEYFIGNTDNHYFNDILFFNLIFFRINVTHDIKLIIKY